MSATLKIPYAGYPCPFNPFFRLPQLRRPWRLSSCWMPRVSNTSSVKPSTEDVASASNAGGPIQATKTQVALPHKHYVLHRSGYSYERLDGDDFLSSSWVPPEIHKAERKAKKDIYGDAIAPVWKTSMNDLNTLGSGITLYFRTVKALLFGFLVMSIIALPAIFLCVTGNRISRGDVLSVASASIGNSGTRSAFSCSLNDTRAECNETPEFHVPLINLTVGYKWIGLFFSGTDFVTCLVFLIVVAVIHDRLFSVSLQVDGANIKASDYSVLVRGLPRNVTSGEVLEHFNGLYDLGKDDWTFEGYRCWFGRKTTQRAVENTRARAAAKVAPADVAEDEEFIGIPRESTASHASASSLAEDQDKGKKRKFRYSIKDSLETGPVLNATNSMDPMFLRTYIADIKLCRPNEVLLHMYRRQQNLLAQIRMCRATMKKYCGMSGRKQKLFDKAMFTMRDLETRLKDMESKFVQLYKPDVEAAFVTFNCQESTARCINDYADSDSFLGKLYQPKPLLFKGIHPLTVSQAPEPTDILWENVGVTTSQRTRRMVAVYALMVIILLLSIAANIGVRIGASFFESSAPSEEQCKRDLPALAYMSYQFPTDAKLVYHKTGGCSNGLHSIQFTSRTQGGPSTWQAPANDTVRAKLGLPLTPVDSGLATCMTRDNHTLISPPLMPNVSYVAHSLFECFCLQEVEDQGGIVGIIDLETAHSRICGQFGKDYALSRALGLIASVVVVAINVALTFVMGVVTRFERHLSISDQLRHLATKMFIAQFINTALMVQVTAIPAPDGMPSWVAQILRGKSAVFSNHWYETTGATITVTMLLITAIAIMNPVLKRQLAKWKRRSIARKAVTQIELDLASAPVTMPLAKHVSLVLTTVFVTLAYSSALPLLIPIALFNLTLLFWFEKFALLRWYMKPPRMSNALPAFVARLLPYAVAIHTAVAVYVYGDETVLVSPDMNLGDAEITEAYLKLMQQFANSKYDVPQLGDKLQRAVVGPPVVIFCVMVLLWLLSTTPLQHVWNLIRRPIWLCTKGKYCLPHSRHALSKVRPQFTCPYVARLPAGTSSAVPDARMRAGWRIQQDPTQAMGTLVETRLWTSDGKCNGVRYRRGDNMLTWHVIRDASLSSYDILANPMYNAAAAAIHRAAERWQALQPISPNTRLKRKADEDWEKYGWQDEIESGIVSPSQRALPPYVYAVLADAMALKQQKQQEAEIELTNASDHAEWTLDTVESKHEQALIEAGVDPQTIHSVNVSKVPQGARLVNVDVMRAAPLLEAIKRRHDALDALEDTSELGQFRWKDAAVAPEDRFDRSGGRPSLPGSVDTPTSERKRSSTGPVAVYI